jgi:hypothetical protein
MPTAQPSRGARGEGSGSMAKRASPRSTLCSSDSNPAATELAQALQSAVNQLAGSGRLAEIFGQSNLAWRPI